MIKTLKFRRANFQFFKEVVDRMPWKLPSGIMELNRAEHPFKDISLREQEVTIPIFKKSDKECRRPAWQSKDLLV